MAVLSILLILIPVLGIWYYLWDEKRQEEKKLEEEKRKEKEDIEHFKVSYTKARNQTTFESITPLPLVKFENDEQIYFQCGNFGSIIPIKNEPCRGAILFYTILTNHKLILFHNDGIDAFNFDELSYFVAYEGIIIVLNRLFERISISGFSEKLAKLEAALVKFGVPYFYKEKQEVKPLTAERKKNFFFRVLQTT
jgi:hypothetical protein